MPCLCPLELSKSKKKKKYKQKTHRNVYLFVAFVLHHLSVLRFIVHSQIGRILATKLRLTWKYIFMYVFRFISILVLLLISCIFVSVARYVRVCHHQSIGVTRFINNIIIILIMDIYYCCFRSLLLRSIHGKLVDNSSQ